MAVRLKSIFILIVFGLSLRGSISFAVEANISDSLVNNLSCNSLSVASILKKIRPDAFSYNNHMPFKNWGFRSGLTKLAACWGMGSTQRKLFYLMRLNEKDALQPDLKMVLDMIRGATIEATPSSENNNSQLIDQNLKAYNIIPVAEKNLQEEYYRNTGTSFLEELFRGIDYSQDSFSIHRDLKTEIERSQERHFFRFKNIGMGSGTGPLSPEKNKMTMQNLIINLRQNRLTLINLRLKPTIQHVVIAKSFVSDDKGNIWIQAYDSNQPEADQQIFYAKETDHFYSPQIMGSFIGDYTGTDYSHPLGVFIVDEEERVQIETALFKYYKQRCQQPSSF